MTARFNIKNIYPLSPRNSIVIGGDILEGEVKEGMSILIGDRRIPIHSLTFIDKAESSTLGLIIEYKNNEEKKQLEQLFSNPQEVQITS